MVTKKKNIRIKTKAMTVGADEKVRLAIECSREQRKYIKMYASFEDKTINDFVMDCVLEHINPCKQSHTPNAETDKALDASGRGEGIIAFDSIEDFFKSMEK